MALKVVTGAVVTVATAGTAVVVSATSIKTSSFTIQADPANTGVIYVGDSSVDNTNGIVLVASQSAEFVGDVRRGGGDEYDLNEVFLDSSVNGETARVIYSGRP